MSPEKHLPNRQEMVALLGRGEYPTDGVRDYSLYLADALAKQGVHMELVRVPWPKIGWRRALQWLWQESRKWRGQWVLVQYTALEWSRRGFPFGLLAVLWMLKQRHCKVGVVYHGVAPYPGTRWVDRARQGVQRWTMRQAFKLSDAAISPVPLEQLSWLPNESTTRAACIPVGPNIPEPTQWPSLDASWHRAVAGFSWTVGNAQRLRQEVEDLAYAALRAHEALSQRGGGLTLNIVGRGSEQVASLLQPLLNGSGVRVSAYGIVPATQVTEILARSHAMLFVRRQISGRRGSAIAGIACGLPIVAYEGEETGFPITEAGVVLVPFRDTHLLAEKLVEVLTDRELWYSLHARTVDAHKKYFAWDSIAIHLLELLNA